MKTLDFEKISQRIKDTRLEKGITQDYVATVADVNTSHISNIENNRVKVSLTTLVQICNALDTTVDYILAGEYPAPSNALEQCILLEIQKCTPKTQEQILRIIQILQH